MEKLGLNEIRQRFLKFFESKGHYIAKSHSLVPENDKSLLLINSGMAPLKNYFAGIEEPPKHRMSTCQKCIRTGDIENVGVTARHATFFEMMGNFSFGDYFKHDAINWGWEFVTEWLNIPADKIWVTVYENDDEAFEIWEKEVKFPKERIVRLGKDDNFWEIGLGPCGPCSEIYFDRGEKYGCGCEDCKPGCECDRFLEFWNLVFTQFDKQENGEYGQLENKNIDTGMGLERMACIMQDVDNIFEVDTIRYVLDNVCKMCNVEYGKDAATDKSIRIITDHVRAVSFMIADGILPSNEGRGYVLRRLLRRAARHGKLLGMTTSFLNRLVDYVIETSGEAYPELVEKEAYIKKVITIEEEKFSETIDQGNDMLKSYIDELKAKNEKVLDGAVAFKLYDTYGFPIDLTREILEDDGLTVEMESFNAEMEAQKNRARQARGNMEDESWKEDPLSKLHNVKSEFDGYDELTLDACVKAIVVNNETVEKASEGEDVTIVLDRTSFYPEGGGQIGDRGYIKGENFRVDISNTKKGANDSIIHIGKVKEGEVSLDSKVSTFVDERVRLMSARNHTATHLLHKALKTVLGEHVNQAGSLVTPERLRFDITHFEAISKEELDKVEKLVNDYILRGMKITKENMSIDDAKKKGATMLFGEKYGDNVRVVSMGDESIELCGGTHLDNTSQVGAFKIVSEGGVASGVRRVEAITGSGVYDYLNEKLAKIEEIAHALKATEDNMVQKAKGLVENEKALQKEVHDLKTKIGMSAVSDVLENAKDIKGVKLVVSKFEDMDMNLLRETADKLRDKTENSVVVLGNAANGKINFVATASKEAIEKGVHSGNLVREVAQVAGGKGGGRPNMAQAGAPDVSKIDEALAKAEEVVSAQIK